MISQHTLLVNCFIGFTKNDETFPNPLRKEGYKVDFIEPSFYNKNNENVNPDIIISSRKVNHSIILDCKEGSINKEQLDKYKLIEKENFMNLTDVESQKLKFDIAFACSEKATKNLDKVTFLDKTMPIFVQDGTNIRLSSNHGRFKVDEINKIFLQGVDTFGKYPTHYYPFGCNDNDAHIAVKILQTIVEFISKRRESFTDEDILKESHILWNNLHDTHKKKLKERLNSMMKQKSFEKVKKHILGTKGKYKISARTFQSLRDDCEEVLGEIQKKAAQTTLP